MKKTVLFLLCIFVAALCFAQPPYLQSQTYDVGQDFGDYSHTYFFADTVKDVDTESASGHIVWKRLMTLPPTSENTGYLQT